MDKFYEMDPEYFHNTFEAREEDDEDEAETENAQHEATSLDWDNEELFANLEVQKDEQPQHTGQDEEREGNLLMKAYIECCKKTRTIPTTLRIEEDLLEWYQQQGPGYQTRMKAALRAVMMAAKADNNQA